MINLLSNKQVNATVVAKFGVVLVVLSLIVMSVSMPAKNLLAIVLLVAALALFVFSYVLSTEPQVVIEMQNNYVTYHHKRGTLRIHKNNIQRCDLATVNQFSGRQNIGYIGFRLRHPEELIQSIPLRLASRLLVEQKDLQVVAGKEQCATGACNLDGIIDKLEWKSPTGEVYQGVIGMYANRTEVLRNALGYDFYIAKQAFNDDPDHIVSTIKNFLTKNST